MFTPCHWVISQTNHNARIIHSFMINVAIVILARADHYSIKWRLSHAFEMIQYSISLLIHSNRFSIWLPIYQPHHHLAIRININGMETIGIIWSPDEGKHVNWRLHWQDYRNYLIHYILGDYTLMYCIQSFIGSRRTAESELGRLTPPDCRPPAEQFIWELRGDQTMAVTKL